MTKKIKKTTAFLSAVAMVMAMLLYFPSGMFSNIDWGLKASAEGITLTEPSKDGSGVYQIGTAEELYWFAALVNGTLTDVTEKNQAANAVLTDNITVNSSVLKSDGTPNSGNFTSWTPIGNKESNQYKGTFDGQNHTISGLYFNDTNIGYVGLFGMVGSGGSVSNVGVVDSYFQGKEKVGGVCGYNFAKNSSDGTATATITNCYNRGTVSGSGSCVGGVCGYNFADNLSDDGTATATITNCYNSGNVSGTHDYVGGVCGESRANCSTGTATATITNCYNTGNVSGNSDRVGGVCGQNYVKDVTAKATITNCYNTGAVNATDINAPVGGVCGENIAYNNNGTATIENCYNTGKVTATAENAKVGGVCGNNNYGTITNCYYLEGKAGNGIGSDSGSGSAESKTTNDMHTAAFCGIVGYHSPQASNGFKCINCQQYEPAVTNSKGEYEISNASQLYWFAGLVNGDSSVCTGDVSQNRSACAVLTANITVNSGLEGKKGLLDSLKYDSFGDVTNFRKFTSWTPIGNKDNQYTGKFDGQGHKISGLYFNDKSTKYVGLFGYVGSGGKVSNVGVVDSYFKGNLYVGGVCGNNEGGTIQNCYNTGNVSGTTYVGGVCGNNSSSSGTATITNCYNTGNVSGTSQSSGPCYYVGGVCGYNGVSSNGTATIENCYNTGTVDGSVRGSGNDVGGVCGENYAYSNGTATITNCYNTGTVRGSVDFGGVCGKNYAGSGGSATITNCYYLNGTADKGIGSGSGSAVPKTLEELCGLNLNGDGVTAWTEGSVKTEESGINGRFGKKVYTLPSLNGVGSAQTISVDVYNFSTNETDDWQEYTPITDAAGLQAINNNLSGKYVLMKDIDLSTVDNFTPIGTSSNRFTGKFSGNGHKITNLTINKPNENYIGLFGFSAGTIMNVGIEDGSVTGKVYVGGVCSYNWVGGTITNCYNTGAVSGSSNVGGVCGYNSGEITNCYNTGAVSGSSNVGGVCGTNGVATIKNCYYDSTVYNGRAIGENNATVTTDVEGKTTAQFKSGEVCYLLNSSTSEGTLVWGQTIGTDNYPVLGGAKVYKTTGCVTYNNNNSGEKAHKFTTTDDKHSCSDCGLNESHNFTYLNDSQHKCKDCGLNKSHNFTYSDNSQHECKDCGLNESHNFTYLNDSQHECKDCGSAVAHSGGTATCLKKAECEICNTEYGNFADHNYVNGICKWCGEPETCQHVAGYAEKINVIPSTCTVKGSFTLLTYCGKCGELMSEKRYTSSLAAHTYSAGGICTVCNTLENGKDGFKSASATLTDGVIMNYSLLLSHTALEDTKAYIHFTSPQGIDKKILLSEGVAVDGRYKFSLELRPDQMADVITAQVVYSDGSLGNSIDYSVQDYVEAVDNSGSSEAVKNLADAMLNFGAFTQLYTGENSDNLAADVTDYTENAVIGDEYKHQLSGNASGITVKGAALQIGAYTTIRVKYQLADGAKIEDFTFKCGETVLTPEKSGDYYYVYLNNIRPQNLDEMYSFTVSDGTNTTTLEYSAFSYMKSILDNPDKYDKKIVNLMNAMYDYNQAAKAYNN